MCLSSPSSPCVDSAEHERTSGTAYDKEKNILVVETVQQFHLFFSPFRTAPSRLVTNVILSRDDADGRHYIAYQEDFYHPDHFMNLLVPPLARVIRFALWSGTVVSGLLACASIRCLSNAYAPANRG